jgi:hypothetical protein
MLAGNQWQTNDFYNHTGVDLILTLENWSWSPSGNALARDFVRHKRSTWGGASNVESFSAATTVYTQHNATHIQAEFSSIERESFDNGKVAVDSRKVTLYYSATAPTAPPKH